MQFQRLLISCTCSQLFFFFLVSSLSLTVVVELIKKNGSLTTRSNSFSKYGKQVVLFLITAKHNIAETASDTVVTRLPNYIQNSAAVSICNLQPYNIEPESLSLSITIPAANGVDLNFNCPYNIQLKFGVTRAIFQPSQNSCSTCTSIVADAKRFCLSARNSATPLRQSGAIAGAIKLNTLFPLLLQGVCWTVRHRGARLMCHPVTPQWAGSTEDCQEVTQRAITSAILISSHPVSYAPHPVTSTIYQVSPRKQGSLSLICLGGKGEEEASGSREYACGKNAFPFACEYFGQSAESSRSENSRNVVSPSQSCKFHAQIFWQVSHCSARAPERSAIETERGIARSNRVSGLAWGIEFPKLSLHLIARNWKKFRNWAYS